MAIQRLEAWLEPRLDFKSDPTLLVIYQIAEVTGILPSELRKTLTSDDLCEWSYFLNSPFSSRGRDVFLNGWEIQHVLSMFSTKGHRPKFTDCVFPFDELVKDLYKTHDEEMKREREKQEKISVYKINSAKIRYEFDRIIADYKAGKTINKYGLKVNERFAKGEK